MTPQPSFTLTEFPNKALIALDARNAFGTKKYRPPLFPG